MGRRKVLKKSLAGGCIVSLPCCLWRHSAALGVSGLGFPLKVYYLVAPHTDVHEWVPLFPHLCTPDF